MSSDTGGAYRQFTAKDVRALTGLSFKNQADWSAKGLLSSGARSSSAAWRRFGFNDLLVLMVVAHLRLRLSVSLDQLRWVRSVMEKRADVDLRHGLRLLAERKVILLLTDLRQHLYVGGHVRIAAMVRRGLLNGRNTDTAVLVNITPHVQKIQKLIDEVWTAEPDLDYGSLALAGRRSHGHGGQAEWTAPPDLDERVLMAVGRPRRGRGGA